MVKTSFSIEFGLDSSKQGTLTFKSYLVWQGGEKIWNSFPTVHCIKGNWKSAPFFKIFSKKDKVWEVFQKYFNWFGNQRYLWLAVPISLFSKKKKGLLSSEAKDFHDYTKGTYEAESFLLNLLIKVNTWRRLTLLKASEQ